MAFYSSLYILTFTRLVTRVCFLNNSLNFSELWQPFFSVTIIVLALMVPLQCSYCENNFHLVFFFLNCLCLAIKSPITYLKELITEMSQALFIFLFFNVCQHDKKMQRVRVSIILPQPPSCLLLIPTHIWRVS